MLSKRHAARSGEGGVVSPLLCVVVLVGSWLGAGAVASEITAAERTEVLKVAVVALNPAVLDGGTRLDLTTLFRSIRPKVSRRLPAPLWSKLKYAYRVALETIRTKPSCSALFTSRGAVGSELLMTASFGPAITDTDQAACAEGAAALIEVRGDQIRLCPRFETFSVPGAALALIHEALHSAGMSERPPDPTGLTSVEISQLVEASCGR